MSVASPPHKRRRRRCRLLPFWLWWRHLPLEGRFYASAFVAGVVLLLGATMQALARQGAFPLPVSLPVPLSVPVAAVVGGVPALPDLSVFAHPLLPSLDPLRPPAAGPGALPSSRVEPAAPAVADGRVEQAEPSPRPAPAASPSSADPHLPAADAPAATSVGVPPSPVAAGDEPQRRPSSNPAPAMRPLPVAPTPARQPPAPGSARPPAAQPGAPPLPALQPAAPPPPGAEAGTLPSAAPSDSAPVPVSPTLTVPTASPVASPSRTPAPLPEAHVRLLASSRTPLGPLFNAVLVPGSEVAANVVVQNEGRVDLTYALGSTPTTVSVLHADPRDGLQLRVLRCSADFASCPSMLYDGPAVVASAPLGGPDTVGRATRTAGLRPATRDYLQLRVRLPASAGNAHKRAQSVLELAWTATEAP